MHFFSALVIASIDAKVAATPLAPTDASNNLMSVDQFRHWLATTDTEITYIGKPVNALTSRSELNTMVTFCSNRVDDICGGPCNVYNGGATCFPTPGTNCVATTNNIAFCSGKNCGGGCNLLSTCGVKLDSGFYVTPETNSIVVTNA